MSEINCDFVKYHAKSTLVFFVLGAGYAALTKGPILAVGGALAGYILFQKATIGIVDTFCNRQRMTHFSTIALKSVLTTLSTTALIVAGIATNVLGPFGVALLVACQLLLLIGISRKVIKAYATLGSTLGLGIRASTKEITQAYRKFALSHHPDKIDKDDSERVAKVAQFTELTEAYEALTKPYSA